MEMIGWERINECQYQLRLVNTTTLFIYRKKNHHYLFGGEKEGGLDYNRAKYGLCLFIYFCNGQLL